jgi:hypothetical protein
MKATSRLAAALGVLVVVLSVFAGAAFATTPRWVTHVRGYDGGISSGTRAYLDPDVVAAQALSRGPFAATGFAALNNVQMNDDSSPPLPQDETSVALDPAHPLVAVAAANDYVSGGVWVGTTSDGGRHWASQRIGPVSTAGEPCDGGDPSVVFSVRDNAFYLGQLCFQRTAPDSEIFVYKSTDSGASWSAPSVVITNRSGPTVDDSVFYDKDMLAVDNNPASRFYGRLYDTYVKFHLLANGRSDYCPLQLASTDSFGSAWTHTGVNPDGQGDRGPAANQFASPVVDATGGLDIAYAAEDCNTSLDRGLYFKRSTSGGSSFGAAVRIDKPGEWADNPNTQDRLPAKKARIPISDSLAFNPVTGSLDFVYLNDVKRLTSGTDISFSQSKDFGATWSHAKTLSTDATGAAAPQDQFFPWIAADEAGGLHAIWFDNRNDPNDRLIETFQADSSDDGVSWQSSKISTAAYDPNQGFFSCGCFIGDYNGIAASTAAIYPVWTDGRNSPGKPNGDTDIFTNVELGGG